MFRLTPVVKNLLLINVAIFILPYLIRGLDSLILQYGALFYIEGDYFKPWQFFTYMFLHADGSHIFGNMLGLAIFGPWLEEIFGSRRFLAYYLITGVGAGILFMGTEYFEINQMKEEVNVFLLQPEPAAFQDLMVEHFYRYYPQVQGLIEQYSNNPGNQSFEQEAVNVVHTLYERAISVPMLGASGAVFGLILAVGLLFPYRRIMLLFPPIPLRVRTLAIFYGAYEIYSLYQQNPADNVAHFAHIGGMLVGYLVLLSWGEAQNRYQ